MELDRYRALICAIDSGSLTAAAERLQYSPSGISRIIAALEEETGFPLLLRERSGVRPTPDCQRMLPEIRDLLFREESCTQLAARIRGCDIGSVTIGTAYSAYYTWLAQVTSAFHKHYPGIQVQLCGGYSTQLTEKLAKRQADLCIISRREGIPHWIPVREDQLMAWVPASHPLALKEVLPIHMFAREPYIETFPGTDIDNARVFARYGIQPNLKFSTMDSYATYSMVEAGLGLSMNNALNGLSWSGSVRILPLDPPQPVQIGIAAAECLSPAARTFLTFLHPHLPALRAIGAPQHKKGRAADNCSAPKD